MRNFDFLIKWYSTIRFFFFFCGRNFDFLIPDAPELISHFLEGEQDMSCKRNAFMMLIHADQERALSYLATCIDQVNSFGDILQLVIVELIYKVRPWLPFNPLMPRRTLVAPFTKISILF